MVLLPAAEINCCLRIADYAHGCVYDRVLPVRGLLCVYVMMCVPMTIGGY